MTIVKAIELATLNGQMVFAFLWRAPFPEEEWSWFGWEGNHRAEPLQYHPVSNWMDGKTKKQMHVDWSMARLWLWLATPGQESIWKRLILGPGNMEEASGMWRAMTPCWSDLGVGSRAWHLS